MGEYDEWSEDELKRIHESGFITKEELDIALREKRGESKKISKRGGVRLKSPEKDLLASLGLMGYGLEDIEIPEGAEAIGYDTMVDNDGFGN